MRRYQGHRSDVSRRRRGVRGNDQETVASSSARVSTGCADASADDGAAFVAYVVVALVAAVRLRWGGFRALVALAAAVPPLTTLLAEWWLRRTGHLSAPAARPTTAPQPEPEPISPR